MLKQDQYPIRKWVVVLLASLCASSVLTAKTKDADTRPPYALFEGMDLQVSTEEGVFPVVGFTKKQILVARNGSRDSLSTESSISYALRRKLTDKWVDLEIVETELFYSQMNSDFSAYSAALSENDREQDRSLDHSLGGRGDLIGEDNPFGRGGTTRLSDLENRTHSHSHRDGYEGLSHDLEGKLHDPQAYADSLRVVLDLDVDERFKGVYLVLIARIDSPGTEPDARPFIQMVGQLKPEKTRRVKVVFKNLPQGCSLLGIDAHVYSQQGEIPHSSSTDLAMLSNEEAFQYSLGKYKQTRGRSEPSLFRSLPATDITSFISEKEILRIKADLIVHPDGSATVDYLSTEDEPITQKLVGMLEGVRFFPAMENGQPTESKISLRLSSLVD
ncbi:MAG: hypothetical protein P8L44_02700 [Opitutales bacterium]|nr:hypothetical protein [Opitutales bacterium]